MTPANGALPQTAPHGYRRPRAGPAPRNKSWPPPPNPPHPRLSTHHTPYFPQIPLKPPLTEEGMYKQGPRPDASLSEGGMFTLRPTPASTWVGCDRVSHLLETKDGGPGAKRSAGVYCAWLRRSGAGVRRNTPVSLHWSSPDCMSDRLSGDPGALNCVLRSVFVFMGGGGQK